MIPESSTAQRWAETLVAVGNKESLRDYHEAPGQISWSVKDHRANPSSLSLCCPFERALSYDEESVKS